MITRLSIDFQKNTTRLKSVTQNFPERCNGVQVEGKDRFCSTEGVQNIDEVISSEETENEKA